MLPATHAQLNNPDFYLPTIDIIGHLARLKTDNLYEREPGAPCPEKPWHPGPTDDRVLSELVLLASLPTCLLTHGKRHSAS